MNPARLLLRCGQCWAYVHPSAAVIRTDVPDAAIVRHDGENGGTARISVCTDRYEHHNGNSESAERVPFKIVLLWDVRRRTRRRWG